MDRLPKIIGERIRNHRIRQCLSQEQLAEKCDLHATYIGQLERGEKNATLESIEKVAKGLNVSFEVLFENLVLGVNNSNIAAQCYSMIDALDEKEQTAVCEIIQKIIAYKNL
jgi:transcriptional regulator with XRE-family HTH domain